MIDEIYYPNIRLLFIVIISSLVAHLQIIINSHKK